MTDLRSPLSRVGFAAYDPATGAIICSGRCSLQDVAGQGLANGGSVIEGDWPFETAYVDLSGPAPAGRIRPSFPAFDRLSIKADGSDAAVMLLPIAAAVVIDGIDHQAEAGLLRFTADSPGRYSLELQGWPYLPARYIVEAT